MLGDELLPAPGRFIGGKYRTVRVLSRSSRAIVVEAQLAGAEDTVVIKVLRADEVRTVGGIERLLRDAGSFCQTDHPSVVRVSDFGESDDGGFYQVMANITGETLRKIIPEQGMEVAEALPLLLAITGATAASHATGTLHHGITPDSVLMATRDGAKLPMMIGFVGGKSLGWGTGRTMGFEKLSPMASSYPYVSPELLLGGERPDARADVYSLGAVAFHVLTGKLPFNAQNPVDLALLLRRSEPPSIRDHRPELPLPLAEVIARAMNKKTDVRFESVAELRDALADSLKPGAPVATKSAAKPAPKREISKTEALVEGLPRESLKRAASSRPPQALTYSEEEYNSRPPPAPSRMPLYLGLAGIALVAGLVLLFAGAFSEPVAAEATTAPAVLPQAAKSAPVQPAAKTITPEPSDWDAPSPGTSVPARAAAPVPTRAAPALAKPAAPMAAPKPAPRLTASQRSYVYVPAGELPPDPYAEPEPVAVAPAVAPVAAPAPAALAPPSTGARKPMNEGDF